MTTPSSPRSAASAMDNFAKMPAGFWALMCVVVCVAGCFCVFLLKKETPSGDWFGVVADPLTALTTWLKERRAGDSRHALEPVGSNAAQPAATNSRTGYDAVVSIVPLGATPVASGPHSPPTSPAPASPANQLARHHHLAWWREDHRCDQPGMSWS
ncbi:uncharacterized protein N7482_006562 [Penicillium canariense]|uniref:Uncharacterized protein n=1 Tax=Penicillium canariense TaxID=189055 RepID=A0A9W9LJH7_9EURO|nr:uncharacterized protein N7482_006562 [Penicillium canariense]KAJ5159558.1 hypothetical protein N7482_006562 [Penicillium canariense]